MILTNNMNSFGILFFILFPNCCIYLSLTLSGAAFQELFINPLVRSGILGVSAGADLGAALAILLFNSPAAPYPFALGFGMLLVCFSVLIGLAGLVGIEWHINGITTGEPDQLDKFKLPCIVFDYSSIETHQTIVYRNESTMWTWPPKPGLCVAEIGRLPAPEDLIAFGKSAKKIVLEKKNAYDLANRLGVHLSEHGGTSQGVIGALAAVGLRMTGNDGPFKGHFRIDAAGGVVTPLEIRKQTHVEVVKTAAWRMTAVGLKE